nr:helix-turn-helix domain-containing protein [Pseudonocardia sediminis]
MTRQTARHPGPARRSRGSWTSPQQRAAAVGQVEAGRSCAAVAAEFEVSDRTVARWRAAHTAAQSAATSGGAR